MRLRGHGAYFSLGDGQFGWAPDTELPVNLLSDRSDWSGGGLGVPCIVLKPDTARGTLVVSPRQAGHRLLENAAPDEPVSGVVVRADTSGILVDVNGAKGRVQRSDMPLRLLRHPAQAGAAWWGYVVDGKREPAALSGFEPKVRSHRAARRAIHLRALRVGSVQEGMVIAVDDFRAVVAFEGGIVFGMAPAGRILAPKGAAARVGRRRRFRVVTQVISRESPGAAELWLAPADDKPVRGVREASGLPQAVTDILELPATCPEWAGRTWRLLTAQERVMFAWQHGLDGPRRSWQELGKAFGVHSQHARRIAMSAEDALRKAAGIPATDWPKDSESRHKILMTVLGLPRKPTANGRPPTS